MPKKRSNLQNKSELLAVRALVGAIGALPLETSLRFGEKLGAYIGSRFPKLQKNARRNLEIALPELSEAEKARIVSGTFESLGRHLAFVSQFKRFKPDNFKNIIELVGKTENFEPEYAKGKGIIFFTGHFGSWEVYNLLAPSFGYPMNILVRRIDNPLVENHIETLRSRFGSVTLDKTKSARKMYRVLENGEILGMMADLNVQEKEGIFVDFFGTPASTTTTIAKLALKTGASVMPAFAVWDDAKNKYVIYLEPAISYEKTGDAESDIKNLTQNVTNVVEKFVRRYPEQWLWIHKRWNTRPRGETELY